MRNSDAVWDKEALAAALRNAARRLSSLGFGALLITLLFCFHVELPRRNCLTCGRDGDGGGFGVSGQGWCGGVGQGGGLCR